MRKFLVIGVAIAALSAFLAQPRTVHAQIVVSGGVNSAIVIPPGGTYGSSVWATLNGGLVYLTCPSSFCNAGDVVAVISTEPGGAPGTTYALVQTTVAATYAAPYSAPVTYSTAYTPSYGAYGLAGGACVLGSYPSLYGCSSASYASPLGYGYGVGYYGSTCGFGGYGCFGSGFGGVYPSQHFGNHVNESGETEPVCPAGQTEHEHGPFAEACH